MRVVETFSSLQGETSWSGLPSFFIRLAGCNLQCAWCDTTYARDSRVGRDRTVEELVVLYRESGLRSVTITGGEPLMQEGTPALIGALLKAGAFPLLVETNGSFDIGVIPAEAIAIVDVKCPGSGVCGSFLPVNLERLRRQDEVKFVIADRADYEWAVAFMNRHGLVARCRAVLFSAAGGRLEPRRLADWMVTDRLGARFQIQLHKVLPIP